MHPEACSQPTLFIDGWMGKMELKPFAAPFIVKANIPRISFEHPNYSDSRHKLFGRQDLFPSRLYLWKWDNAKFRLYSSSHN